MAGEYSLYEKKKEINVFAYKWKKTHKLKMEASDIKHTWSRQSQEGKGRKGERASMALQCTTGHSTSCNIAPATLG